MTIEPFIFFAPLFALPMLALFGISFYSKQKFNAVSSELNLDEFVQFNIKFKEIKFSKNFGMGSGGGMFFFKAVLYYSKDLIIIQQKNIWSVFFSTSILSFPLLLSKSQKENHNSFRVITPYSINKNGNFPLLIKYRTDLWDCEISIMSQKSDNQSDLEQMILAW